MKVRIALATMACLLSASNGFGDDAKKDLDKLEGTWGAISYVDDGQGAGESIAAEQSPVRWKFQGGKVTLLADVEGASPTASVELQPEKKPKRITLLFPAAANEKQQQRVSGIYELDGDTLKLCYLVDSKDTDAKGAAKEPKRPTEFKSAAGSKQFLIVFKRIAK